jgi:hypothetical protein
MLLPFDREEDQEADHRKADPSCLLDVDVQLTLASKMAVLPRPRLMQTIVMKTALSKPAIWSSTLGLGLL